MAEFRHGTDYHTQFDTKVYLGLLELLFNPNDKKSLFEFRLRPFHNFWSNFEACSLRDSTGVRCLEYGGGPCIGNLISASPKVDHIVFSEYIESCRQAVRSWKAGSSEAYNWSPWIEFVVRDLEGESNAQEVLSRAEDLKQKIKSVVHCDVTKNPIVDLESEDIGKPFDVVSSSLCLEAGVSSEQEYKNTVAKLCKFLKPNGYLCMFGVLKETFYSVGKEKFRVFPLTQVLIEEAMEAGGLQEIKFEQFDLEGIVPPKVANAQFMYFVSGRMSTKESNKGSSI